MSNRMAKVVIETSVKKALGDIRENSGRGIRNLVDRGLQFSKDSFQRSFLTTIQGLLKKENSAYYHLAYDVAANVDEEHLITFGTNMGYHACIEGVRKIRDLEADLGYTIPWLIPMGVSENTFEAHREAYGRLIEDGMDLGIFCWALFIDGLSSSMVALMEYYKDSAFILFCEPECVDEGFIEALEAMKHVVVVVRDTEKGEEVCRALRKKRILYAVFHTYTQEELPVIENGKLLERMEAFHPVFSVFIPDRGCAYSVMEEVDQIILKQREGQAYQTLPLDLYGDWRRVNRIISKGTVPLAVSKSGEVILSGKKKLVGKNIFMDPLGDILQEAFSQEKLNGSGKRFS